MTSTPQARRALARVGGAQAGDAGDLPGAAQHGSPGRICTSNSWPTKTCRAPTANTSGNWCRKCAGRANSRCRLSLAPRQAHQGSGPGRARNTAHRALRTRASDSDVPFRVVITEGVGLAKKFGATDGHRYVNAVLDRCAAQLRAGERGAPSAEA